MRFNKKYSAETAVVIIFFAYLFTLAPSVIQIDSGELAAVQATLGIAHPTGYPLFTVLGNLFLKIPLPFTKIYRSNLLAALWCCLGIFFFIKSALIVLNRAALNQATIPAKQGKKKKMARRR